MSMREAQSVQLDNHWWQAWGLPIACAFAGCSSARILLGARRHTCVSCLDQVELVGSVSPRSETKSS